MAAVAVPVLAAAAVYWLLAPEGAALLALAAAAAFMSLLGAVYIVARIDRRPDDRRVARFIEERVEALPGQRPMDDCVVSAVQASATPGDGQGSFAALVIGAAMRRLAELGPETVVPPIAIRRSAGFAAGAAMLLLAASLASGPGLSHAYETAQLRLFPGSISVEVGPGHMRVAAGHPVTIAARVHAGGRDLSRFSPTLRVTAGGESRVVAMVEAGGGFEFRFESVDRTFDYVVTAGSATSRTYTVTALFPPRVQRIGIQYQYPAFSGLAPRTEQDGGDIYAPAGTRVRLSIHADKPIAAGELALSAGTSALEHAGDHVLHADLLLSQDDGYRIRLTDRDGLTSSGDSEYFIRLMDDRPPDVRILRPSADQGITPLEEVLIEARAEDDYGVASLELVYAVGGGAPHTVPFGRLSGGETQRTGAYLLAAEDLRVKPGDVITVYAQARDVGRGKRPTETRSDLFFLEVRPFNEEFVAAQSQAGGRGGGDQQLDSLIEAQKEIISATWNIERRSSGGRSAADIKAIAQAQTELKARAERAIQSRPGRPGGGFLPQQVTRPPQTASTIDAVGAAVAAMTRAIEQLTADRTGDAIPYEMAALNGLLQAQAEVRRREIAQQQNSSAGGRGSNRQTRDLSALFDKELQRQQQTNYEQRSQIEQRPEQARTNQEALDRIRDLAQRQDALNQRQRELERLAEAERRRELARLTRDQQDLQRHAEELSRQMGQESGQRQQQGQQQSRQSGQQQGQGQALGQGSSGVRTAAEQMQQAAGDMQRNDRPSAAQSGKRAADQLRRLEQQMRGDNADAKQRAAADLQAEAQQIAQEQRRIAADAQRLEKNAGAGDVEAGRRLAAEKDRLADRVEALGRQASSLGAQPGKGQEQSRARDAAGQLAGERVGETMREGARQMRDGSRRPSGQSEQQLARALDQVAQTLAGAVSDESRRMAGQLDQSRETRESLDQLEARMAEAKGKRDGQFEKLEQQYEQALRNAREAFGRSAGEPQQGGRGGATPESQQASGSAPGTEAFKQDRSSWASLRKAVDHALEEHDAAVSRRLAKTLGDDRLSTGGSQRVPEQYRHLVAKYYESLARVRK